MRGPMDARIARLCVSAALLILLGSCAQPPVDDIREAQNALERALDAQALVYASSEMRAAEDSLAAMRNEVDRQRAKFFLFRRYSEARRKAIAAREAAELATATAVRTREEKRIEAEGTLAELLEAIASLRAILDGPQGARLLRAKESRNAIEEIRTELNSTDGALENVRVAQKEHRYSDAAHIASETLRRVQGLADEVQQAIDRIVGGS